MIYNLIIAVILIMAFFMCIKAYTLGLKHGKELGNATIPKMDINPIKAYTEHKQAKAVKKEQDLIAEGLNNIMSYDGTPQEGSE